MNQPTSRPFLLLLAGGLLGLVGAQSVGALTGAGYPELVAPHSIAVVFPLFAGFSLLIVVGIWMLVFWGWTMPLLKDRITIPKRTIVLYFALMTLSVAWFVVGWSYGVKYEGIVFTLGSALLSAALCVATAVLLRRAWRQASFLGSLVLHWLLFAWMLTFAFPYLGETP